MTTAPDIPHDKLLDLLLDVVCVVDRDGRFLSVSAASERVFGYSPEEMIGRTAFEFIHPEDHAATLSIIERINAGEPSPDHENRYRHKDGHLVHIMWSTQWFEAEQVRVGVARDITARKQVEAKQAAVYAVSEAAHAAEDLPALYQRIHELIAEQLPAHGCWVAMYNAASSQLDYPYHAVPSEEPPAPCPLHHHPLLSEVIGHRRPVQLDAEADGEPAKLAVPLIYDTEIIGALAVQSLPNNVRYSAQDAEFLHFVANQLATAISRQRTHARLSFLAQHDQLTQLANRALFMDRLQSALQRAQRSTQRLAVLYLDLDSFKQVNDSYGHAVGDQLLQQVAARLRQSVRESDSVGRLGGDEFAVLLDNIGKREDAAIVAEKILASLSAPFMLEGLHLISTPSLGIAVYPEHGQNGLQLIRHADDAMYSAKRDGGKRYQFCDGAETL